MKLAALEIYVWDGERSLLGRALEGLGRLLGPVLTPAVYEERRILAGKEATRANVRRAIAELAASGFAIDVFSSVHGYPIQLADGPWLDPLDTPGLEAVRVHYTTACHGAAGAPDFLRGGVRAYVAAPGVNWINVFHMTAFARELGRGKNPEEACERATRLVSRALAPLRGPASWILRRTGQLAVNEPFSAAFERTRPSVFAPASKHSVDESPGLPPRS